MSRQNHPTSNVILWLIGSMVVIALLFTVFPNLDIKTSALFYHQGQFPVANMPVAIWFRAMVWHASEVVFWVSFACWCVWGFGQWHSKRTAVQNQKSPFDFAIKPRILGYVVALYTLGVGVLVNGLLKSFWGRARPAETSLFGGTAEFTPALFITNQCSANCSFVSGEAAGATVLAIIVVGALWLHINQTGRYVACALMGGMVIATSGLRVASGRHFLSDVLLAILLMLLLAYVLARILRIQLALPAVRGQGFISDIKHIFGLILR